MRTIADCTYVIDKRVRVLIKSYVTVDLGRAHVASVALSKGALKANESSW